MSNFNVNIKVDPGSAIPTIKAFDGALASAEVKAIAVEKAAAATGKAVSGMATGASAATAALQREADMLERIRKPMRDYYEGNEALDALYQKNKISAEEYRKEIDRLNASISKTPKKEEHGGIETEGSVGKSVAGQFGEAGNVAAGLASGTLEVAGVVALAAEVGKLGDEYTGLANKATRFADAGHSTNDILHDQLELSKDIHGSLEQTIELYSAVREGTDGMNLSYHNQITLTKALSEEVQLSGKSLDQAGGLMAKLSFAFESGTLTGRELKGMFREFPALAETLRESFGKTSAQLITMANTGRLTPKMIMDALIEDGPKIEGRFGKMTETMGQQWQHMKDGMVLSLGRNLDMASMLSQVEDFQHGMAGANEETRAAIRTTEEVAQRIKQMGTAWGIAAQAIETAKENVKTFHEMMRATDTEMGDMMVFTNALKGGIDEQAKIGAARRQLEVLHLELKQGTITGQDYRSQYEALMTTINNGKLPASIKVWNEIHDAMTDSRADLVALNGLWGTISASQYDAELAAIVARTPEIKRQEEAVKSLTDARLKLDSLEKEANQYGMTAKYSMLTGRDQRDHEREVADQIKLWKSFEKADNDAMSAMEKAEIEAGDKRAAAKKQLASEEARINTDKWKAEIEGFKKQSDAILSTLKPIEDGILQMVQTGKMDFESMIDSWVKSLEAAALHKAFESLAGDLASLFGGGATGPLTEIINGVDTGRPLDGGHHATGGSYTVPGSGPPDSQRVMFALTPGEQVHFTPPGSPPPQASGASGAPIVKIVNQHDTRGELLDTIGEGAADTHIINVMRRNAGALRALLR